MSIVNIMSVTIQELSSVASLYKGGMNAWSTIERRRPSHVPTMMANYKKGYGDDSCYYECTGGDAAVAGSVSPAEFCKAILAPDHSNLMGDYLSCVEDHFTRCTNACGFSYKSGLEPQNCGRPSNPELVNMAVNRPGYFYPSLASYVEANWHYAELDWQGCGNIGERQLRPRNGF